MKLRTRLPPSKNPYFENRGAVQGGSINPADFTQKSPSKLEIAQRNAARVGLFVIGVLGAVVGTAVELVHRANELITISNPIGLVAQAFSARPAEASMFAAGGAALFLAAFSFMHRD